MHDNVFPRNIPDSALLYTDLKAALAQPLSKSRQKAQTNGQSFQRPTIVTQQCAQAQVPHAFSELANRFQLIDTQLQEQDSALTLYMQPTVAQYVNEYRDVVNGATMGVTNDDRQLFPQATILRVDAQEQLASKKRYLLCVQPPRDDKVKHLTFLFVMPNQVHWITEALEQSRSAGALILLMRSPCISFYAG
jgi:hypothetical protein